MEMKEGEGKDDVRGVDVIRVEDGTEGAMTKSLNQRIRLNLLIQRFRCQMGQERWVMVVLGWVAMRSVEM